MAGFLALVKSLRRSKTPASPRPQSFTQPASSPQTPLQDKPKTHAISRPPFEILHSSISAQMLSGMHTPTSDNASIYSLTTFRDYRPPGFNRLLPRTRRFTPRTRNIHGLIVNTDLKPSKTRPLPLLTKAADCEIDTKSRTKKIKTGRKGRSAPRSKRETSSDTRPSLCCIPSKQNLSAAAPAQSNFKLKPKPKPRNRVYAPGESHERKEQRNRQPKPRILTPAPSLLPQPQPPPLPSRPTFSATSARILDVGITASPTQHQILDVGITQSPVTYLDESAPQLPAIQKSSVWSFQQSPLKLDRGSQCAHKTEAEPKALGATAINQISPPPAPRTSLCCSRPLQSQESKFDNRFTSPIRPAIPPTSPITIDGNSRADNVTLESATLEKSPVQLDPRIALSQIDVALAKLTRECALMDEFLDTPYPVCR